MMFARLCLPVAGLCLWHNNNEGFKWGMRVISEHFPNDGERVLIITETQYEDIMIDVLC